VVVTGAELLVKQWGFIFLFFDSLMHCGTTMYKKTLKEEFERGSFAGGAGVLSSMEQNCTMFTRVKL
jgi:hypothetical protein